MILTGTEIIGKGKKEAIYAECECSHPEHVVKFIWFHDDKNMVDVPELFIEVGMVKLPFWERIWYGVKYILGYRSNYIGGSFEETTLSLDDVEKLVDYLNIARDNLRKENERYLGK